MNYGDRMVRPRIAWYPTFTFNIINGNNKFLLDMVATCDELYKRKSNQIN